MKMSRFTPYLGIVAALALGVSIVAFSRSITVSRIPTVIIPAISFEQPAVQHIETTSTSMRSTQAVPLAEKSVPATPAHAPVSLDASASSLRRALVNIMCDAPARSGLHSISASGVFVDAKGVILTNAHVAQYFLLADRGVSCTIRSGSPAADAYNASLIYISPAWIQANPTVLIEALPTGTGENDFALLAVTKSASTTNPLPSSFPSMPLATRPPVTGTQVAIASYGAQFLESNQIQSSLFPTVVLGSVKDVFTFAVRTIDVLALGGSAVAQEGSSGGGVADASGKLVGTITTSTVTGSTDTRSLDAITSSYIRAEYASETGSALDLLLAKPTGSSIADFASHIPALEAIITANL